jgi:hypothetical protein
LCASILRNNPASNAYFGSFFGENYHEPLEGWLRVISAGVLLAPQYEIVIFRRSDIMQNVAADLAQMLGVERVLWEQEHLVNLRL